VLYHHDLKSIKTNRYLISVLSIVSQEISQRLSFFDSVGNRLLNGDLLGRDY